MMYRLKVVLTREDGKEFYLDDISYEKETDREAIDEMKAHLENKFHAIVESRKAHERVERDKESRRKAREKELEILRNWFGR